MPSFAGMIFPSEPTDLARPSADLPSVLIVGPAPRLGRALTRRGYHVTTATVQSAVDCVDERLEAVIIDARSHEALDLCQRLKTRFQVPLLPVNVVSVLPTLIV